MGDHNAARMRRVAEGDERAFGSLYDELAATMHGIVLRVVRDPAHAEEVTQEALIELWRRADRYDAAKGSVRGWAVSVAHRRAVDRVRAEQASRSRDDREARRGALQAVSASTDVEDRMEREQIRQALIDLTALQRQAIELAYYEGFTYREVAALLRVPEGTVKTRIRDGLIRLRDALGPA